VSAVGSKVGGPEIVSEKTEAREPGGGIVKPRDCPRFHSCGAPICVLDPAWPKAVHLHGEPVCHYALASGKPGAAEKYADDPVYRQVLMELPLVCERHSDIKAKVARAARTGFRGPPRRASRMPS
jgi:hypothetical protein